MPVNYTTPQQDDPSLAGARSVADGDAGADLAKCERETCWSCGWAEPCGDGMVICRRVARGFDNNPVENERHAADRGPCIHHLHALTKVARCGTMGGDFFKGA